MIRQPIFPAAPATATRMATRALLLPRLPLASLRNRPQILDSRPLYTRPRRAGEPGGVLPGSGRTPRGGLPWTPPGIVVGREAGRFHSLGDGVGESAARGARRLGLGRPLQGGGPGRLRAPGPPARGPGPAAGLGAAGRAQGGGRGCGEGDLPQGLPGAPPLPGGRALLDLALPHRRQPLPGCGPPRPAAPPPALPPPP